MADHHNIRLKENTFLVGYKVYNLDFTKIYILSDFQDPKTFVGKLNQHSFSVELDTGPQNRIYQNKIKEFTIMNNVVNIVLHTDIHFEKK